jgi:tetratricopeptide (TPR) repeat protein
MNEKELSNALTEMLRQTGQVEHALPIIAAAFSSSSQSLAEMADSVAFHVGTNASPADAEWLEDRSESGELGLAARIVLLGYYFRKREGAASLRRQEIIYWLIENAPACPSAFRPMAQMFGNATFFPAFSRYRQLWLDAVKAHESSPAVHIHAAMALQRTDEQLADRLLLPAIELEPNNPDSSHRLAHLYQRRSRSAVDEESRLLARQALSKFRQVLSIEERQSVDNLQTSVGCSESERVKQAAISKTHTRLRPLKDLARAAYDAGECDAAEAYANEALALSADEILPPFLRNDGEVTHHCHLVLGRLALRRGDVALAGRHLLEAGKTKGSPALMSFGPNMLLAQELLEVGERDAVLEYFELCGKFWKSGKDQLEIWTREVREGRTPFFDANLRY